MSEKKRWDSIDFIKGLACIAVVFIHFNFPGDLGIAVRSVCKFGVPVFFFVSGFFLGWMPEKALDANKIVKKIKHILIIVGGGQLQYMLFIRQFIVCWYMEV